jgi:hypothetical protein
MEQPPPKVKMRTLPMLAAVAATAAAGTGLGAVHKYGPTMEPRGPWPTNVYSHCKVLRGENRFSCKINEKSTSNTPAFTYKLHTAPGGRVTTTNEMGCPTALTRANREKCHSNLPRAVAQTRNTIRGIREARERNSNAAQAEFDEATAAWRRASSIYIPLQRRVEKARTDLDTARRTLEEKKAYEQSCQGGLLGGRATPGCYFTGVSTAEQAVRKAEDNLRKAQEDARGPEAEVERLEGVRWEKQQVAWRKKDETYQPLTLPRYLLSDNGMYRNVPVQLHSGFPTPEQYVVLRERFPDLPDPYTDPYGFQTFLSWCNDNKATCSAYPILLAMGLFGLHSFEQEYRPYRVQKTLAEARQELEEKQRRRAREQEEQARRRAEQMAAKLAARGKRRGGCIGCATRRKKRTTKQTRRNYKA